jgi:hypothetical protein
MSSVCEGSQEGVDVIGGGKKEVEKLKKSCSREGA